MHLQIMQVIGKYSYLKPLNGMVALILRIEQTLWMINVSKFGEKCSWFQKAHLALITQLGVLKAFHLSFRNDPLKDISIEMSDLIIWKYWFKDAAGGGPSVRFCFPKIARLIISWISFSPFLSRYLPKSILDHHKNRALSWHETYLNPRPIISIRDGFEGSDPSSDNLLILKIRNWSLIRNPKVHFNASWKNFRKSCGTFGADKTQRKIDFRPKHVFYNSFHFWCSPFLLLFPKDHIWFAFE